MRLRDLPRPAMLLVAGVCLAGGAAATACLFLPPPEHIVSGAVILVLAFVVGCRRVRLHVASISLGFVLVFAALFHCGTIVAVGAALANTLACSLIREHGRPRPSLAVIGYNACSLVLAAFAAGAVYNHLRESGVAVHLPWPELWAAGGAVVTYHGFSVASLGLISTLYGSELDLRRWWRELLATAPAFLAGGAFALALDYALIHFGRWVFVLGVPFAYVIHHAYRVQGARVADEVRHLRDRAEAGEKMAHLYLSVVEALSNAIDMKDHGTLAHVQRVHSLARAVAKRLGLTGEDLEAVKIGAVLHDIGKLAVPDHILRKPGRLTDAEFRLVKEHAAAGEAILRPIDFGVPVCDLIRHHHEKLDGSGYPDGLAGDQIALGARILAVIDVYDALVSDRPYRKAWTSERAVEHLREEAGRSFDPVVVEALAQALAESVVDPAPQASESPAELALPDGGPDAAGVSDALFTNRVAQEVRHCVLRGLARLAAEPNELLAAVAYDVSPSGSEMDAVAAVGPSAAWFDLLRLSVGRGVSGGAARDGLATTGRSDDDFEGFLEGAPAELADASVTAIPVTDSQRRARAVLSLYHADPDRAVTIVSDEGLRTAIVLAAHQLEAIDGEAVSPTAPPLTWPAPAKATIGVGAGGS